MIEELTTYISGIQQQFPLQEFVYEPARGLHIMLEVKEGAVQLYQKEIYTPKKENEIDYSDFLRKECLPREMHIDYIESHKALIGKEGKKIHSATPFALKIRKKSFDEEWKNWFPKKKAPKKSIDEISKNEEKIKKASGYEKKILQREAIELKIDQTSHKIIELLERYFEKANEICSPTYEKEDDLSATKVFQKYCISKLPELLKSLSDEIIHLNKNDDIIILFKNIATELYQEANSNYIKDYVFNVDYFNKSVGKDTYGLSGYLNTASDKKPYLRHLTAPFDINIRIPQQKALLLNTFERYRKEGAFRTNPLPIFIDHTELNSEVINVVRAEGNQVSFQKIIRTLYENKKGDLGNYCLFYFWGGGLKDLDFVSSFSYSLDIRLRKVIPTVEPGKDIQIKDIFQFEHQTLKLIFNNFLIQKRKDDTIGCRYFEEIDNNPKYNTATTWNLVMKYRKAFYDFIYKSRRQSVTTAMFHDIMRQGIFDDIRHDEVKENHHTKSGNIHRKLNIWFSLWSFFGKENTTNDLTMANKIEQHQERMRKIRNPKSNEHIQTDDEFAFAVGQIIYYLLNQSKTENKTHALLEPFLQKTDVEELKKAIVNTFNAYKHEIDFGKGRFEKLCGEIMDYKLNGNLKELLPYILAGYFSNSLIYEKSETSKS